MSKVNFSDDYKRDAVLQITQRGCAVSEVSQRLGVSKHSLYAWKKKFGSASEGDDGKDAEIRRLKRELTRVTEECDILKKHRVFCQRCKVRYAFVAEHRPLFSIRAMCRSLRIHPSSFYAWLKNPLSRRAKENVCQTALIQEAWKDSGKVYGYRMLHDDLLDRKFDVGAPDRLWVTDITYIRTQQGFAYLAVVIDLYSRRVIGWCKVARQRIWSCRHCLWRCGAENQSTRYLSIQTKALS